MGLYNREYSRDSYGDGTGSGIWSFGEGNPVCKNIIIACAVVFIGQLLITRADNLGFSRVSLVTEWLALSWSGLTHGCIWQVITYAFCHDIYSIWHIVFNMLWLWWFGSELERIYGSKEFLAMYLVSAAFSGLGFLLWQLLGEDVFPLIGASGAVMAVIMLYTLHFPRQQIGLFFGLLVVEMRFLLMFIIILEMYPVLLELGGAGGPSRVAHVAHLAGLAFGWAYYRYGWRMTNWLPSQAWNKVASLARNPRRWWKSRQARKMLKVYQPKSPASPSLEEEVDRILQKISDVGEASLTPVERDTLTRAAREYRQRG
jgi:membrane associated rhomboid family serine protease